MKIKKTYIIVLSIIAFLIALRLILPVFIFRYTNKVLSEMEGYRGSIQHFDLTIINLGFIVEGFKIEKLEGEIPVPFIYADRIETILEWKSILKGVIVGQLNIIRPNVNFVKGKSKKTTQTGTEGDWTTSLKKLKTYTINKITIDNGKVSYYDFYSKPKVEVYVNDLNMSVTNITNLVDKNDKLPSHLELSGTSIGKGLLKITADMNLLKKVPDFDANVKFTKVNLPALNNFIKAYGKFDFEQGEFSLFSEVALSNESVKGYAQPMLEKIKVLSWEKDKDENIFQKMWEGLIGTVFDVTKNMPHDRFATKIPFEGNVKDIGPQIFPTIINIFKNEFVKVFPKSTDNSININSAEKK